MKTVLFVCLGNICRSPMAEAVLKKKVEERGLENQFEIDSAGTSGYHAGEPADRRMREHGEKRGYQVTSISRPFKKSDFKDFGLIVVMDEQNMMDVKSMADTEEDLQKLRMMTDYCTQYAYDKVPDPYYGGAQGFDLVIDLLEDACEGLLEREF